MNKWLFLFSEKQDSILEQFYYYYASAIFKPHVTSRDF